MGNKEPLKSCPHCGGIACLYSNYSNKYRSYYVFVKCEICEAQGKAYKDNEPPQDYEWNTAACYGAVKAWNMRYNGE